MSEDEMEDVGGTDDPLDLESLDSESLFNALSAVEAVSRVGVESVVLVRTQDTSSRLCQRIFKVLSSRHTLVMFGAPVKMTKPFRKLFE